jgi:D-aminopeptidase
MGMIRFRFPGILVLTVLASLTTVGGKQQDRARDLGIRIGILEPGLVNAITDVKGVTVGHTTLIQDSFVRTGVTVILPHRGNLFQHKVPAAVHVGNGFGKLVGISQIQELGNIETPIALTNTLSVWTVADALADYTLTQNPGIQSVNPVVGETNDGWLNDIQGRHVRKSHVFSALENARDGPVQEGNVGAGTGTRCLGFKGGIGSASRQLPADSGGFTVGVLVQTNFGGILRINGIPVPNGLRNTSRKPGASGSCMIVVATDAPLESRNLHRLARRAILGMARIGGTSRNGSGDYVIAFSTHPDVRVAHRALVDAESVPRLRNELMSPLFLAVIEATEEAILNSLLAATTMQGRGGHTQKALPLESLMEILSLPRRTNE